MQGRLLVLLLSVAVKNVTLPSHKAASTMSLALVSLLLTTPVSAFSSLPFAAPRRSSSKSMSSSTPLHSVLKENDPNSLDVAASYNNIGVVLKDKGDLDGALEQYQLVVAIKEVPIH